MKWNGVVMSKREQFKIEDAASYNGVASEFDVLTNRFSASIALDIVRAIDAPSRSTIVDIGCGTGLVALEAAKAAARTSQIFGLDLSDGMLKIAAQKARNAGLNETVSFHKGDAENLDWADNSVDGYVSLHAYRHFPHPDVAAKEAFRVLQPGGRAVVAIGSAPKLASLAGFKRAFYRLSQAGRAAMGRECVATTHLVDLVAQHVKSVTVVETAEWSENNEPARSLLEYFEQAGFSNLRLDWSGAEFIIPDVNDFWVLQTTLSTPARKRMSLAQPEELKALKTAFWDSCEAVLNRGGRLTYCVGAAIVVGEKPT